jgi:type IX secretion system PorP/SprF family membrane protein
MKKKIIWLLLLISIMSNINVLVAQQDSQFTQYMYNMSIINPAYATSDFNNMNMGLSYRQQWLGVEGTPKTATLFGHLALKDNMEIGASFFNDNIGNGVLKESKLSIDYAYILNLDRYSKLSFGIKAGFNMLNINFDGFQLESGDQYSDDLFKENVSNIYPNIGSGLFYFTKKTYIGFSIPNFLKSPYLKKRNNIYSKGREELHYYFTAGHVFDDKRNDLKIKPSFMIKTSNHGKMALDLSLNAQYDKKFEMGLSYRLKSSVNILTNYAVSDNMRIGYSYDYTLNNLSSFNSGSHELVILYDFNLYGTNSKSPRFF